MDHKKSRKILVGCIITALILIIAGGVCQTLTSGKLPALVGAAIAIIGVIQAGIFMRCPHCRASLYTRGMPKYPYCPQCGNQLEW